MAFIHDELMRVNSGSSWIVMKGQRIRITFESILDFVVFNLDCLDERFDQARTKANLGKIYISANDVLYSKLNHIMMTIVEDNYKGHHDLQYGMCSGRSYDEWWKRRGEPQFKRWFEEKGVTKREDLPLWGCYENIMNGLQNYPIIPLDIPAPFNIGQSMDIDPDTGLMKWRLFDRDIPEPGTCIELRAEMNCLCAGSNCPQIGKAGGYSAKPIRIQIIE
jgi:uncharacterized protein YcgI (DUF1989 family)